MKKTIFLSATAIIIVVLSAFNKEKKEEYIAIPPGEQRSGDAAKGYQYLVTGDFLRSGFPYKYFNSLHDEDTTNYLHRSDKNATVNHGYNVVKAKNGVDIVIPTCLQCHAQVFDDKLIVGLGNSFTDYSIQYDLSRFNMALRMLQVSDSEQYHASSSFFVSLEAVVPYTVTTVRGVSPSDVLAAVLAAHRDPQTLVWSDEPLMEIPEIVVPTDIPAWWLLKKKNAMFYTGLARGDFGKFLMLSNMLTVEDTAEAADVNSHFGDVLAYIRSIQPPKYPKPIDEKLAAQGKTIFNNTCSRCHGTYGANETYPNLLIPGNVIQTDSMLYRSNQQDPRFANWFNKSWFAQPPNAARIVMTNGYVAPPLDGVWITGPYLHNGSVPTIEAVLNSRIRPKYWTRDFDKPVYDYQKLGWKYTSLSEPTGRTSYNTTLQGYGNFGHYFGDVLTDNERKAVIEYIKTL